MTYRTSITDEQAQEIRDVIDAYFAEGQHTKAVAREELNRIFGSSPSIEDMGEDPDITGSWRRRHSSDHDDWWI